MSTLSRVLVYSDDLGLGGVAQYNHALLCGLAQRGHPVTCVRAGGDNPLSQREAALGVRHFWLDFDPTQDFGRTVTNRDDARRAFASCAGTDLVVFSNSCPVANFAAKEAALELGLPFVVVENFASISLAQRFSRILDGLARHYAAARAVAAVSHENHELLCRHFHLPVGKGTVIYYGRPPRFFLPPDPQVRERLRHEINVEPEAILCLSTARLDPIKGYSILLAAIERLRQSPAWPNLQFVWLGDGTLRDELTAKIRQLGIEAKVHMLGWRWDVEHWLDAADMLILPSLAEGMPLAVIEAMAKGLPVIASEVSGIPEAVGSAGRLLPNPRFARGTVEALAAAVAELVQDPSLRRRLGLSCQERARFLFQEDRMLKETYALLDRALLPHGDYVSAGLEVVRPDRCFPQMAKADPWISAWPHLRRHVPHNWYIDRRWPQVGWLNRDEASLLYNSALQFAGSAALEIGCFCGWSTCHLALAGVDLDVVDPLLSRGDFAEMVRAHLRAAEVVDRVHFHAGPSPEIVAELGRRLKRRWSLMFIDGDHSGKAPLHDAQACARHAAEDAMILFHDLTSPDVARGFVFLRDQGWHTVLYQTMQIMGAAYRGNVRPVVHRPDPNVAWSLPEHLQGFLVSGCSQPVIAGCRFNRS